MAVNIHHIERIKFAVAFYISGADKIGLMNVIKIQWLCEIRILNALGNIGRFFLMSPSLFSTRLIVLSEGRLLPALANSHLIAEGPI